jgi:hypothetical protein
MECSGHENDFEHMDLDLSPFQLQHEYHLGEKADTAYEFILHYVSCRTVKGAWEHRDGSFHYALHRERWATFTDPSESDRAALRRLALAEVPGDLAALERSEDLSWFDRDGAPGTVQPKFLT